MYLSELQSKDVVNIKDGKKIGNIVDVSIDNNGFMNNSSIKDYDTIKLVNTFNNKSFKFNNRI